MKTRRHSIALFLLWVAAGAVSAATPPKRTVNLPLLTRSVDPKEFGIQDDTATVIAAVSFLPNTDDANVPYYTSASFGRFTTFNGDVHYYATLNVPSGAVIDSIGVNNLTDTDAIMGIALWARTAAGNTDLLTGFSFPAHGTWQTDYAGPLNIGIDSNANETLILDVEQAPSATWEYFAFVEVDWHRQVSPPPGSPTFNDVPASDPAFQFIEALAASGITTGCGGGNYCPDNPVTRRQMAVFLSKALGLHWPN